jgi:hypothetical protein
MWPQNGQGAGAFTVLFKNNTDGKQNQLNPDDFTQHGLVIDTLPPLTASGIAGDSKNHFLGFLFPRVDLPSGVASPKYWSVSPEALVPM